VVMILLTRLAIIVAVVFVELGQRRIPVQFAKRVVGRRMMGGQNTYIPLKVNQSGVIPIIFASSILLPAGDPPSFLGRARAGGVSIQRWVDQYILNSQNDRLRVAFALLIIAFAYFYNSIAFDPAAGRPDPPPGRLHPRHPPRSADRALPRQGLNRITLPGALFIALIAITAVHHPVGRRRQHVRLRRHQHPHLGRCGARADAQIDSQLMLRNYEGFLK
jgi:preprotein translocase subunit SecY